PARLEADTGMGLADSGDAVDIGLVEIAVRKIAPMALLRLFRAGHMRLVTEEMGNAGCAAHLVVKLVERTAQQAGQRRAQITKGPARRLIHLDEIQAFFQRGL